MIATYVSALNDCPYCLDSHASFLRTQGGFNELLSALSNGNLEAPSISAKERQLLRFTRKVKNESYKVTADDIRRLNDVGWNQLQIAEATHITALFAFFNRVANTFGLPSQHCLDLDLAPTNSKGEPMSTLKVAQEPLYLRGVEEDPKPSVYHDLIENAKSSGGDYWQIWHLLAFDPEASPAEHKQSTFRLVWGSVGWVFWMDPVSY